MKPMKRRDFLQSSLLLGGALGWQALLPAWAQSGALATQAGIPCRTVCETSDNPYDAILRTADAQGCDLIVMTSHGRKGLAAVLLGSETRKVLTHARIPVLVVR